MSSEKSVNSRQLDGQRYVGVEAMKRRSCRLRETCVAVGQRVTIIDKLNSASEPLHSHFLISSSSCWPQQKRTATGKQLSQKWNSRSETVE